MAQLSGPLLDRIDLRVDVPALIYEEIVDTRPSGASSGDIRATVQKACDRQRARCQGRLTCNAHLDAKSVREHCTLNASAGGLLRSAMDWIGLNACAYDKVLRVARTLADLDHADPIQERHVTEAIQYRSLDRQLF